MTRLVECVPNFSEGRDNQAIQAISSALESVDGVMLMHVDSGFDANRTVMTFISEPEAAVEAGVRAVAEAARRIDMRRHAGVHRRIGATDVFPIIPYENISFEECAQFARILASRVSDELGIPVYLYGKASDVPGRERLPDIRRGGYEGLARKLKDPAFTPDFGEPVFHPSAGATVIGARDFLLAYNVNLDTADVAIAKRIAREIRESGKIRRAADGKPVRGEDGRTMRIPGKLSALQADGWYIAQYGSAQVTMNLLNIEKTGLHTAFEAVKQEARALGVGVNGSELVGLCPKRALIDSGEFYLNSLPGAETDENRLFEAAVEGLGLDVLAPFEPRSRIIEYAFEKRREASAVFSIRSFL